MFLDNILGQSIQNTQSVISDFIDSGNLDSGKRLLSVFGSDFNLDLGIDLIESLATGETTVPIEILPAASINDAQGAFGNDTIYLSEEVLATGDVELVTRVLLEEIGHFIDASINSSDAPGDEGAIFAEFVLNQELDSQRLALLQAEDDSTVVNLDGSEIVIEQMRTIFVNASGTGGDGTSWNSAFNRLQDALASAEAGDEIWVADGTYFPTIASDRSATFTIPDGVRLYGGFAGGETSLSQRDIERNVTILSGDTGTTDDNSDNSFHVVTLSNVSDETLVDGFTITAGNADGGSGDRSGGGIRSTNSDARLANLVVINNSASNLGGGFYSEDSQHQLNNVEFVRNATISTIFGAGGGFYSTDSNDSLVDVIFRSNFSGDSGGGLYNNSSSLDLLNVEFIANRANDDGGAIFNDRPDRFTLTGGTFLNNSALDNGGAIFNDRSSDSFISVSRSIFQGNVADAGGAIFNFRTTGIVRDSLFVDNHGLRGGGIYNDESSPDLINNTFEGNIAQFGAGIGTEGDFEVQPNVTNSIFSNNLSIFGGEQISDSGSFTVITNSLVEGGAEGSNIIDDDPRFVDSDNFDFRLRSDSPALNAGTNNAVNLNDRIEDLDLAGNARIIDGTVDLGAFEGAQVGSTPSEPQASDAATIIHVDRDATGNNDGSSWENAYSDLQTALRNAPLGSQIWVAEGTYLPSQSDRNESFQLRDTITLYGGFAGNETSLEQRNIQQNRTVLSGELGNSADIEDNSIHVVNASNVTSSAVLDGFTIRAGNANGALFGSQALGFGGGIFSRASQATFRNLILEENNASRGGGLFVDDSSFHILENVDFIDNTTAGDGGAVFNEGNVAFFGSTFTRNSAADDGGAFFNSRGDIYIEGSEFDSNQAGSRGGAIVLENNFSGSNTNNERIINSVFFNNQGSDAGAIYNINSDAEGINLTFANNQAERGAAVFSRGSDNDVTPEYTNSIFFGNVGTVESAQIFNDGENTIVRSSIVQGGFAGQNISDRDPLFVNQAGGDLRVRSDSVAINSGLNDFVIEDQDVSDRVRIFDNVVDIGAYEYSEAYIEINDPRVEVSTVSGELSQESQVTFDIQLVDSASIAAPQDSTVTVEYRTVGNSAVSGEDFVASSGSVTFEPGQTSQTVTVPVFDNRSGEGSENFFLEIAEVRGDVLGFETQGIATIVGESSGSSGSGNDGSEDENSGNGGSGGNGSGNGGSGSGDSESGDSDGNDSQTIQLFRFRNTSFSTGTYIFVGEGERDAILNNPDFNQTFSLDGVRPDGGVNPAFTASTGPGENLIPFFRLSSLDIPGTFLFVSTGEYDAIFAEGSDQRDRWLPQGFDSAGNDIAEFYLQDGAANSDIERQFNRFQNTQNGTFLYAGFGETNAIENDPNLSSLFTNQGVAFASLA